MENLSCPPVIPGTIRSFFSRLALTFKLFGILILVLLLQIPLFMIRGVLAERLERRNAAIAEITETWGRSQTVIGPILVVPYRTPITVEKESIINGRPVRTTEERMGEAYAYFLPDELNIEGDLAPYKRHRGIYEAVVYGSRLKISGSFGQLNSASLNLSPDALLWDRAWLAIGITDLRGTREALKITWDGKPLSLAPGTKIEGLDSGLHTALQGLGAAAEIRKFSIEFALNGSSSIAFAPLGVQTSTHLRSTWADPGFTGAFLPAQREISPNGFDASWQLSYYGRDFAQQWTSPASQSRTDINKLHAATYGVNLVTPVDSYRSVERAIKYGALFITLLFTAFFLFEVLSSLKLHGLHYLLVGAALCLFYLALLSLSEFITFNTAYFAAAAASTLLIGLYCRSILRSGVRSLVISGALIAVYGFLFFVLQMQDYALVAGTAGLFATLALVMYATRKVDWSNQSQARATA